MELGLPRLYPVTDRELSRLSHARQVEELAAGGATLVQLRDKTGSPGEFYDAALEAMKVARRLGLRIIINDRSDIALAVGADGVHLGQSDLPPEEARRIMGPDLIIGVSSHTEEQALEAASKAIDYIAIGPVFHTTTKTNPDPLVGLDLVRRIKKRVSKPLVAIGGIRLENALSVIEAGADSVAVISDLYSTGQPAARTRDLIDLLRG
jgi:thiamine-phosphate pyrophosphorylase